MKLVACPLLKTEAPERILLGKAVTQTRVVRTQLAATDPPTQIGRGLVHAM